MKQKSLEEIQQAIKEQAELCKETGKPHFAPYDGRCYDCNSNIYQNYNREGWNGKSHVTGCPHCHYSFCE